MYILTSHKKGISSLQLGRDVGITQKSAWFVNHRIREMLKDKAPELLSNIVEVDETFVGGLDKNRHVNKRKGITGTSGKMPVMGLLERQKKVIAHKIKGTKTHIIQPEIYNNVEKESTIVTDSFPAYRGMSKDYGHIVVDHKNGQYTRGIYDTNSIENFWSHFKRGIYGIYHSVSEKHLDRYVTEFSARYNTRKCDETVRFNAFLTKCAGRLKYNDLIDVDKNISTNV